MCVPSTTPQSPKIPSLDWHLNVLVCIEPPSAARSLFLSLSFPLHPPNLHVPSLFHILLHRFYPEAELDGCYNLTSTFLSPVTAAFARMNTGKAHVPFFLFSYAAQGGSCSFHNHCVFFFLSFRSNNAAKTKTKKRRMRKSNVQMKSMTRFMYQRGGEGWIAQRFSKIRIALRDTILTIVVGSRPQCYSRDNCFHKCFPIDAPSIIPP